MNDQPDLDDALAGALAAAQAEMPNAEFDSTNPHFKNRYASLAAIRKASLPVLSKHGLAIAQTINPEGLVTLLLHKSGGQLASIHPLPDVTAVGPQKFGSALTYARRYSWQAIVGIAADEDDDGNAAQQAAPAAAKPEIAPLVLRKNRILPEDGGSLIVWAGTGGKPAQQALYVFVRDIIKRDDRVAIMEANLPDIITIIPDQGRLVLSQAMEGKFVASLVEWMRTGEKPG